MMKKILAMLIALTMVAGLAACASMPAATNATEATQAPVVEATEAPAAPAAPTAPAATEAPAAPAAPAATEAPAAPVDAWGEVDPTGQTAIFWHQHTKEREEALNQIVADFNANNEWGITVEAAYQGSYNDIFNKMLAVLNTPDAPQLVVGYQNQAATYQLAEALADRYLAAAPPPEVLGFLRADYRELTALHGRIYGLKIRSPKLVPLGSVA